VAQNKTKKPTAQGQSQSWATHLFKFTDKSWEFGDIIFIGTLGDTCTSGSELRLEASSLIKKLESTKLKAQM
jgi:hypothetical protein